jgi:hypothetical protein
MVGLDRLKVDAQADGGYARPVSEHRIRHLQKEWNPFSVQPLAVSRRDGNALYLIDGQHRAEVARLKGLSELPAIIFTGLDRRSEADLYLRFADALPQQAVSQFRARLARGDHVATVIKQTVESVGLKIGLDYNLAHADDGTIVAVTRLERIYTAAKTAQYLYDVLRLIKEVWGVDHRAYQQVVLEAVWQFWAAYREQYDRDRLVTKLREAGIEGVLSRAYAIQSHGEWPRRVDAIAVAIWRVYHEPSLRSHRLEPWAGAKRNPLAETSNARGSRASLIERAREERATLSLNGGPRTPDAKRPAAPAGQVAGRTAPTADTSGSA